jgi:hypothetical protein
VGLAASTKWNAAVVAIVPALVFIASWPTPFRISALVRSPKPYLMALAAALGLILATPAVILSPAEVASFVSLQATQYSVPSWNERTNGLLYQVHAATYQLPWIGGALFAAGSAWLTVRVGRVGRALVAFMIVDAIVLAIPPTHFERNLLPIAPILAVGSALALTQPGVWAAAADRAVRTRVARLAARGALVALLALTLLPTIQFDVAQARKLRRSDTRTVAREWILK